MTVKKKILAICASILLLIGISFAFVGCDNWHYDLESDNFLGIDEQAMRDPNSEFVTLYVGETNAFKKNVIMRKDVFETNPFFNMFTSTGYKVAGMTTPISYLTHDIVSTLVKEKLEIQYLRIGGVNYFYDFEETKALWEAIFKSPLRPQPLAPNTITEEQKEAFKPVVNPIQMGGKDRKYFVIESVAKIEWKKERAILNARVFGTQERVQVLVMTDSMFYRNLVNDLNSTDTTDTNLARVRGGVNYRNQWYLVHQV